MAHTKVTKNGTQNTGTANTFSYSGSFDVFKASEVEVELDNIALTFTTSTINESASPREYTVDYNAKTVHIGGANLTSNDNVVIQPVTDMGDPTPRATYAPGASVTSDDLNNNQLQLMRKAMEYNEQKLSSRGGTMTGNLHLGQNVDLSFEGDNDNAYETTITVADPTSDKTITFPDTTGTVVTTGDTGTVATAMIAGDAVNGDKIADDAINSEHYAAGSIDHEHLANDIIDGDNIQDDVINSEHIAADSLDSEHYAPNSVDADALAHTSVTAGSYTATDLTVDAQGRITAASSGTIAGSEIAADAIDGTKIADDSINSEHYVDGSIDTAHIADAQVTQPKLAANAVATANIADNQISTAKLIDNSVTTAKINADAITNAKIADDSIDSEHYVDGSIDTAHIAGAQVTDAKLASNSVTTSKITDSNVTTVKIADSNVTLAKLASDLKQTSISDSDTQLPTSGAVVDYVAAQIAPLGGLEVVATDAAFPNVQPQAGVVISISDAGGVAFNGSGTSTTARTVGGSTVTINNAPSSLNNETLVAGVGLMVSSTGSSQTYNYHKILGKEDDIKQLSDDINDFNARYRVGSSNPTTALDSGDLFFNTGSGKLLVYNGTASAWEEAQSIGQYFINTISSYSGTGGNSASFNGAAYRFVLSNAGAVAEQHIVSINGVIQKPNSGTSQPSEGFAIDGSSIIFSSAPATGADFFIITIGSTVNIGTPSDGTITASKLTSGAVEQAKIADGAVSTAKIADDAVNADKLASNSVVSASIVDGSIVNADVNASAAIAGTKISPDFGSQNIATTGSLSTGQHVTLSGENPHITFTDTNHNPDYEIYGSAGNFKIWDSTNSTSRLTVNSDGHIDIDGNVDFGAGIDVTGNITVSGTIPASQLTGALPAIDGSNLTGITSVGGSTGVDFNDNVAVRFGTSNDAVIKHDAYSRLAISFNDASTSVAEQVPPGGIRIMNDNMTTGRLSGLYFTHGSGTANVGIFAQSKDNATASTGQGSDMWFYTKQNGQSNMGARARFTNYGHFLPAANSTYDLGDSSYRWRNIYTNDLNLSNEGSSNDMDGTWGDWTIQEGESDLFLKNNRSGKKYKFNLTEVS